MTVQERKVKRADQQMRSHSYAISIEDILFKMRNLKKSEFEQGIKYEITADDIEPNPFASIEENLQYYSKTYYGAKDKIQAFINDYDLEIMGYSMSEILSIVDNQILKFEIEEMSDIENGEEYIIKMIDELRELVKS